MAENAGAVEYEVSAKTKDAVDSMNDVVNEVESMVDAFNVADKRTKAFESNMKALGNTINKQGQVIDRFGNVNEKLTSTLKTLNDETARLKAQGIDRLNNSLNQTPSRMNAVTKSFKVQQGATQQLGFQLQDIAVQAQQGTSAFVILGQQGSQLASLLGPGGALLGALIAVGSAMLGVGVNALSSAGAIDTFLEKLKELSDEELAGLTGQKQETAVKNLEKAVADYGRQIEQNEKEVESLRQKEAELEKQRDEARTKGFAGAVESARIKSIQKDIENLTIANQSLTESRDKDQEKLGLLTKETNVNQEAVDRQVKSAEELAAVLGKNAVELAQYNKQVAINKLEQEGATEAEIARAAAAYDSVIAFTQRAQAERDAAQATKDKNRADKEAARLERERAQAISTLRQVDPAIGVGFDASQQFANLEAARQADLLSEEAYQARKLEITQNYEQQLMDIAEQRFRAQSESNEFLIGTLDSLASTATSTFSSFITGASTAQDVVRSLANTVLNQAVGALVQVGLEMVKNQIIGQTAQTAAAATAAATGSAIAASYATAAAFASLASFGANAAPAAAGIASTVGLAQGLSVAGGLERGGMLTGAMTPVGEGNKPEVLSTGAANFMIPGSRGRVFNQQQLSRIGGSGEVKVDNVINNYSSAAVDSQVSTREDGTVLIETIVHDIRTGNGPVSSAMDSAYPSLVRKTR